MSLRKIDRSTHFREFVGSAYMVIQRMKSWVKLTGFSGSPIEWILDFDGHENFMKVLRDLFTLRYGSIYVVSTTEELIEEMLNSCDPTLFKLYLVNGVDSVTWQKRTTNDENLAVDDTSCSESAVNDEIENRPNDDPSAEVDHARELPIDDVNEDKDKDEKDDQEFDLEPRSLPALNHSGVENMSVVSRIDDKVFHAVNDILEAYGYVANRTGKRIVHDIMNDEHLKAYDILIASEGFTSLMKSGIGVYEFCMQLFRPLQLKAQKKFPVVIYACPGSGKSHFNKYCLNNSALDTDAIFLWNGNRNMVVLTNIYELLLLGRKRIALLPTRSEFDYRCKMKGLEPTTWHGDLTAFLYKHKIKPIKTNEFLSNIIKGAQLLEVKKQLMV